MVFPKLKCNKETLTGMGRSGGDQPADHYRSSLPGAAASAEATLQVLAAAGRVCMGTVDVVAVIEVLIVESRAGRHKFVQAHFSDEQTAGEVEVLQEWKPPTLR